MTLSRQFVHLHMILYMDNIDKYEQYNHIDNVSKETKDKSF